MVTDSAEDRSTICGECRQNIPYQDHLDKCEFGAKERDEMRFKQIEQNMLAIRSRLRPLPEGHWSRKKARQDRLKALSVGWKRLAQKQHRQISVLKELLKER